jgi:hypothetical protein
MGRQGSANRGADLRGVGAAGVGEWGRGSLKRGASLHFVILVDVQLKTGLHGQGGSSVVRHDARIVQERSKALLRREVLRPHWWRCSVPRFTKIICSKIMVY